MKKTAPQILVSKHFQQFINASVSGKRISPSYKKIAPGTIKNYSYVLQLILEYEQKKEAVLRIQLLHKASMRTLLREKNYWAKFYLQFSSYMYSEKGYSDNYVLSVFKTIQTFFTYLQSDKGFSIGNYHKSFKIPLQKTTPVVLLPQQLQYLITDKAFDATLNKSLKRTKDIFVFGCTVALRISDLMKLEKKNIVYTSGEAQLKLFTQKTGTEVTIPLPSYAIEIINHYKSKAGKYILPRLAVSNLNIQVKKLIKKAGWDHLLIKVRSKKGNLIEIKNEDGKSWRFYQHITAHTMRRTAITTLLIMGVPELIVRKISGHAPGSKEFYRYVNIAQDYMNQEVKVAFKKLVEYDYSNTEKNDAITRVKN
jgi:integrase